jgi:hypothetical protein
MALARWAERPQVIEPVAARRLGIDSRYALPDCVPEGDAAPMVGEQSHIDDLIAGLPKEHGSVRNVTIAGDPRAYMCEVRTLPGSGLGHGDIVWVEFGAYWTELRGERTKQRGQWRRCKVLANAASTQADVHVT